jgi:FKBP-type peptidyl-prolyl cis-trans isomerase
LEGMRVGGARELVIPARLGYGSKGVGSIPGNATLIFRIQLIGCG